MDISPHRLYAQGSVSLILVFSRGVGGGSIFDLDFHSYGRVTRGVMCGYCVATEPTRWVRRWPVGSPPTMTPTHMKPGPLRFVIWGLATG